jgi:CubicO group peptidase (beta-lactamase class C family)
MHQARSRWFRSILIAPIALTVGACHRPVVVSSPATAAGTAADASLRTAVQADVQRVLDKGRADSAYPGAFAVVGTHAGVLAEYGAGTLDWAPSPVPDEHTMWDLASLSKVIGLTTAIMQLVEQGRVDLDAPLQRYIPTWTGSNKEKVTVRELITHTSGLPAFKAYDEITHDPDSLAKLMFATPLETPPGTKMVYSDIGAYMLGRLVEQLTGQSLDLYLHDHVFEPLAMHETMYRPPISLWSRIAPTELDTVQRHRLVRGMVHDERAYYLGGVSAHAGLFSTGHDLARFAEMYLNGGTLDGVRLIQPATIARFTAYADSAFSNRALGWQKQEYPGMRYTTSAPWAGHTMSSRSFGHTGFTGTSIGIDPTRDLFVILLSNRVDPTRNNNKISGVRRELTDAVVADFDRLRANAQPRNP